MIHTEFDAGIITADGISSDDQIEMLLAALRSVLGADGERPD